MSHNNACQQYQGLLMGLIDQELSSQEASEVNDHLIRCSACREEFDRLNETSRQLQGITFTEPTDEVLNRLWKNPFNQAVRWSGLLLLIGGYLALLGFGLTEFLRDTDEAVFPKICLTAIIVGFAFLLLQTILERLKTYQTDPYKDIQR